MQAHIGGWFRFSSVLIQLFKHPDTFWAPIFYVLMPWRSAEVYERAYQLIDEARTFPWPPSLHVMMDFEMWVCWWRRWQWGWWDFVNDSCKCSAMRAAWVERHPDHLVHGCMFHMSQVKVRVNWFGAYMYCASSDDCWFKVIFHINCTGRELIRCNMLPQLVDSKSFSTQCTNNLYQ